MSADFVILGQGLMGTCVAWELEKRAADFKIFDRRREKGSSMVAAGLVTPITGKGLNPSWKQELFLPEAIAFYREIAARIERELWNGIGVFRLFKDEKEIRKWQGKAGDERYSKWIGEPEFALTQVIKQDFGGLWMPEGGWVDLPGFLWGSRDYFAAADRFELLEEGDEDDFAGATVIRCEGFAGLLGGGGKHRCAKGEILTVKIPDLGLEQIVNRSGWLVPLGNDCYRAGATYEWDHLDEKPTHEGRHRVEEIVASFTNLPFTVLDHVAGVRPIIRQSIPLVRSSGADWWINGLGSKGSIYAPGVARQLLAEIFGDSKMDADLSNLDLC